VELGPIDVWSTPKDEPLPALPWDQELELDLGDDSSYSFAATVQNSVLFPDFSLLMDFPEDGLSAPLKETDLPGELSVKEGGDNPPSPFPAEVERESRPSAGWQEIYPDSPTPYPMDVWELESRYDLGLGYKEMGLYAQAIEEFAYAAGNPQRRLDCLTLQAICYREKGEPAKAQALLQRGRSLDVLTIQERMFLDYELAFLLEMTGLLDEAILMYSEVQAVDPSYRDVDSRLSKLLGREPLDIIDLELVVGDS
jgi:tetratricopeptide (TPR) repeat protein